MRKDNRKKFDQTDDKLNALNRENDDLVQKMSGFEALKQSLTLSISDRNRLEELTDFYRHLNGVIETIIDRFSTVERTMNKFIKVS